MRIITPLSRRSILALTGAGASGALMSACARASGTDAGGKDLTEVVVAATPTPHAQILRFIADELATDAGLRLVIEEQTDYQLPNRLLAEGEVDANLFQHAPFLEQQIAEKGYDITPFGPSHLAPMGLYSQDIASAQEVSDGARVALPNDPTNLARGLILLSELGLITLADGVRPADTTPDDVADNPRSLQLEELDAAMLPRTYGEYDIAAVPGNYALNADLSPVEDALISEDPQTSDFANVLAVRTSDAERPELTQLDELLHSQATRDFIAKTWPDGAVQAVQP